MKFRNLPGILLALATVSLSQNAIRPIFPLKDGSASPDSCSGDQKELVVDGAKQSVGWLVFKPHYADSNDIRSAMLMVHITSVLKPGLCGIHTLMTKITVPENRVTLENVRFDDMPVASLALDTSFSDQMLLLDVTDLVKSKSFNGIALRSISGLSARFGSKEGFPPPAIIITRDSPDPNPPKWYNCNDFPEKTLGKQGDYYVYTSKGVIYRKSAEAWDSVASLTIPPPLPERSAAVIHHTYPVRRPLAKKPPVNPAAQQ
ncbi:MAG: hypothetical protein ABSF80_08105 [Chitinispirillaceae bacterium]